MTAFTAFLGSLAPDHDRRVQLYYGARTSDLFVFGGPSRLAYHGVTKIISGTAPKDCGIDQGRINITLRTTGLSDGPT